MINQSLKAVPDAYLGVWRRRLLTTRAGLHDDSTEVYWLQTRCLHADLRIPVPTPAADALTLAACTLAQQAALGRQAGFAGLTQVEGDICQWHRLIDFQPAGGPADIGRMTFEGPDRLIEDGLDGSYHEIWERLPGSVGANHGRWLQAADGSARHGCLLVAGEYFLFAAERAVALPNGGDLSAALQQASAEHRHALLAFELSFGLIEGWAITHSTLPGRVGQALLPAVSNAFAVTTLAGLGAFAPAAGWTTVEPVLPPPQEPTDERS